MKPETTTPKWIDSLVDNLAPGHLAEEIRGDLYELYHRDHLEHNAKFARTRYIINGLGFLAKSFFWKKSYTHSTPLIMIQSYFKMARRSLMAYKGTSTINILGLVIGIASTLVILKVIRYELSFDSFHSNRKNIYRVVRVSGPDLSEFRSGISYPVPVAMKEEIPSLKNIVALEYFGGAYVDIMDPAGTALKKFREESGCALVQPAFFKIFDFNDTGFKWISGNPNTALNDPFSVVVTQSIARKYFGDDDALGQTLRFQKKWDCKVTGVIEDLPPNTDFPLTILISYSSLQTLAGAERLNDWSSVNDSHSTFVVLDEGTTKSEIEKLIAKVHENHTSKELHEFRHYLLEPLSNLHFDARFGNFNGRTISRPTILALGLIALFLILTASINYINLATAQATLRAKEIGLRKVMGSNRTNLFVQFLTETFLIVCIAGIIALGIAEIMLFNLQTLLNLKLTHYNFSDPFVILSLIAIIILLTILSGSYPSLLISRFNAVSVLKNKFSTERLAGFSLRKVLVVVQFTITQILVVGTFIVVSQMHFFQNVDMGFNREAIVTTRIPDHQPALLKVLEDQLRSKAFVSDVSFSYTLPSGVHRSRSYQDIGRSDAAAMSDYQVFEYESIDPSYLGLYHINLLAGRNLTEADTIGNIMINKTLLENLQLGQPEDALGKELKMGDGHKVTVVGIVDNFYSNSLKEGVDNIVMLIDPGSYGTLSIKLSTTSGTASLQDAVKEIEKIWTASFPEFIFTYQFFDENVKAFYAQERKYSQLFQLFSVIFLLIGCLGLYGLISFVVNRKGKEVAIRKVLGATIRDILILFSREYVRLILLSFLIAVPIAYYAVNSWLSNFAQHITLHWWLFILPGLSVLLIALLVVTSKSVGSANANPIDKLKYE